MEAGVADKVELKAVAAAASAIAVLEAAFDPFKEWDKTQMTELAKRLDIST